MLGKKHLIAVGGKTEVADNDAPTKKTDTTLVPVAYNPMPEKWYDELIHMFFARLIIDLSATDAKFAWVALQNHVGYIGIAYTDDHKQKIIARLVELMKVAMADTRSRVYNAAYATAIGVSGNGNPAGGTAGGVDGDPPAPGTGRRGGRGRGRGRGGNGAGGTDPDGGAPAGGGSRGRGGRGGTQAGADGAEGQRRVRPRHTATATEGVAEEDGADMTDIDMDDEVWDPLADEDA